MKWRGAANVTAIIQVEDDSDFDKSSSSWDKSSDTSDILNVEPTEFPDILKVVCKRKRYLV